MLKSGSWLITLHRSPQLQSPAQRRVGSRDAAMGAAIPCGLLAARYAAFIRCNDYLHRSNVIGSVASSNGSDVRSYFKQQIGRTSSRYCTSPRRRVWRSNPEKKAEKKGGKKSGRRNFNSNTKNDGKQGRRYPTQAMREEL